MKNILATALLVLSAAHFAQIAVAQERAPGTSPSAAQPDNSKVNKADRASAQPTAQDQPQNKPDRELTAAVRKAIVSDKALSTYAHNVKVVAQNGTVTLRGPVRSDEEKAKVAQLAQSVPNVQALDNRMTVTPSK
jgi:osmotically-inducible protein OsmY